MIRFDDIQVDDRQVDDAGWLLARTGVLDHFRRDGMRWDVNETIHFARQLEFVKAQTYDIEYARLKSMQFIPVDSSAPPGTESITYRQWDRVTAATVVNHMSDDLPKVNVFANEFTQPVKSLGSSYEWSIQDIRRAAMAGTQFDTRLSAAARLSIDHRIDEVGATGIPECNTTGFLNDAAVPINPFPNAGAWAGLTAAFILENLNDLVQSIIDASLEVERPNTLLLPTAEFGIIAQTPFLGGDGTKTILTAFLENSPYITNVDQWVRLGTAGAAGVPRVVAYDRSDRVLQFNIPLMFEQLPPQPKALSFEVPVHARVGAVEIHYPLAIAYGDIT